MRVPNLNLGKYQKSFNKTQKVIRTISNQKPHIHKRPKQEAETERELHEYLTRQKELESETQEKLNKTIENLKVQEIQYNALLLYGIKLDREKILEILKARKAK